MLSSVVGMVGEMYYGPPVRKAFDDFVDAYEVLDDTYEPTHHLETLESRNKFDSDHTGNFYEILSRPSNPGRTKASYKFVNSPEEATEADHIENLLEVVETTTYEDDLLTGKEIMPIIKRIPLILLIHLIKI